MLPEVASWLTSHWPFIVVGLLVVSFALSPFLLRPRRRLGSVSSPTAHSAPHTDPESSRILRDLRDLQGVFETRLSRLRQERQSALRSIHEARTRGEEHTSRIYEKDHYEVLRLLRTTEQALQGLKGRYHRIRAALYAAQDEQAKARTLEAQSRSEIDDWLAPEKLGRRSARHRTADERLDLLVRQAHAQGQEEDPVGEPDWDENLRAIAEGLRHLDTPEVRA